LRPPTCVSPCLLFDPMSLTLPSLQYDRANELKQAQEAKQRETRRKRELGQLPPHAPRWFARALDKDTGEQYWEPSRAAPSEKDADGVGGHVEYWEERSRVAREGGKWSGVEEIFVKEDEI
jgi:oxysterol-binding protein 1